MEPTYKTLVKQLNNIRFVTLKNYEFGYAGAMLISSILYNKQGIITSLKSLVKACLFKSFNYEFKNNSSKAKGVLFFYSNEIDRSDHIKTFINVANCTDEKHIVIGRFEKHKLCVKNLINLLFIPIWLFQIRNVKLSLINKIEVVSFIASMAIWIRYLKKFDAEIQLYTTLVTYFDANSYENILVQYFKQYRIPTATLQHGHYNATVPETNDKNLIGCAFEGFVSDKFLVWGKYTKNEAIKNNITDERIVCVGNPKYIGYKHKMIIKPSNIFGIVLDGGDEFTKETNITMLEIGYTIAKKRGMRYVIKPHPRTDISIFSQYISHDVLERICDKSESVETFANSVAFSIVMGSSVYAELLYIRADVFRYVFKECIDRYKEIDWGIFETAEELLRLIDIMSEKPDYFAHMNKEVSSMLSETGDIENNYRIAIEEMIHWKDN